MIYKGEFSARKRALNEELRMKNEECRPDGNSSFGGEADILHSSSNNDSSFLIHHSSFYR